MKNVFLLGLLVFISFTMKAQTKIKDGTGTPASALPATGSLLELQSTQAGLRLPQVSLTDTKTWGLLGSGAAATAPGMTVYNTNASITNTTGDIKYPANGIGEYYWDGTGWVNKNATGTQTITTAFAATIATPQAIPANTLTKMNYTTESYDRGNNYSTTTSTFIAPSNGIYQVTGCITWGGAAFAGTVGRSIRLYKNGVQINGGLVAANMVSGEAFAGCGSTNVLLAAGDIIEMWTHVGGSAITVTTGSFEVLKMSN